MRRELVHKRMSPILASEPVCLGFVIFLVTNITRQRAMGDVGDRMPVERSIKHSFRLDIIE